MSMWDTIYPYVAALGPTAGILVLFYFIIKYIFEADRRERLAQAQWERENPTPDRDTADSAHVTQAGDQSETADSPTEVP